MVKNQGIFFPNKPHELCTTLKFFAFFTDFHNFWVNQLAIQVYNSSTQDFWENFVHFLPIFGEIWFNLSTQKNPGLMC